MTLQQLAHPSESCYPQVTMELEDGNIFGTIMFCRLDVLIDCSIGLAPDELGAYINTLVPSLATRHVSGLRAGSLVPSIQARITKVILVMQHVFGGVFSYCTLVNTFYKVQMTRSSKNT